MKRIVLVGGGTGGHFFPLIAVAEHIRANPELNKRVALYYFGPNPYDEELLAIHRIQYIHCPAGKLRKYGSWQNIADTIKTFWGILVALKKLFVLYPDTVFSKGGYTSVPVVVAAFLLRIPIVIHESDSKPGSANKLARYLARYIAISFPESQKYFPEYKTALTGIPLRAELNVAVPNAAELLGLPTDRPIIFVTGGSSGAERLNILILESLHELLPYYTILHQTGSANAEKTSSMAISLISDESLLSNYFVKGFLSGQEMNLAQEAASLIISRAGATSIFEIAQKRKPSILIPIPEAISHDQRTNAYAYARTGAATVIEEGNMKDGLLTAEVFNILNKPEIMTQMSQASVEFAAGDASAKISNLLLKIADEHL